MFFPVLPIRGDYGQFAHARQDFSSPVIFAKNPRGRTKTLKLRIGQFLKSRLAARKPPTLNITPAPEAVAAWRALLGVPAKK